MSLNKTWYIVLVAVICFSVPVEAERKTVKKARSELDKISTSIYQNEKLIKKKKKQKRKVNYRINKISKDLRYTEIRLKKAKTKVIRMSKKVKLSQTDVVQARTQFNKTKKQFSKQILSFYKNKNHGLIEYVFMPKKLESFSDSVYYLNKVVDKNINLIGDLKRDYRDLTIKTNKLQNQLSSLSLTKTDIKRQTKILKRKNVIEI